MMSAAGATPRRWPDSIRHSGAPRALAALTAAGLLLAGAGQGRAQSADCREPNVLIMLDVSDSMGRADATPPSKYDMAIQAIHQLTQSTEAVIRYGLMLFPTPAPELTQLLCNVGSQLAVDCGSQHWDPIYRVLFPRLYNSILPNPDYFGGPLPDNWTPMYQALDAARQVPALLDATRRNYLILLTDGKQNCCGGGDYDDDPDCIWHSGWWEWNPPEVAENRDDLVAMVGLIASQGVGTFVVGFGGAVDPLALDRMAQAGGTARAGCAGEGAGDCFYQALDQVGLTGALQQIAQIVRVEQCDGIDNDCDGQTDEGVDELCETACGSGFRRCVAGQVLDCDAPPVSADVCDGVDNDCDGVLDPGCPCVHGETLPCGPDTGICVAGTRTCDHGVWGPCQDALGPDPLGERCDGLLDDDCDGLTDEGCKCVDGQQSVCGMSIGVCSLGLQTCVGGTWGVCRDAIWPALVDACDGLDDDCDGVTDEYCSCVDGSQRACGTTLGVCTVGAQRCAGGLWGECGGAQLPVPETCDDLDNDCDGEVDEGDLCGGAAQCRCGVCVGPCQEGDLCRDGGLCVAGACVIDSCRPGTYCDGYRCVPGQAPVVPGDDGGPVGVPDGCDCSAASASAACLWVGVGLALVVIRRGLRRRR